MWVNSVDCSDIGCVTHKQYDPATSSTFINTGLLLEVEFGTGTLSGEICSDDVYVGNVLVQDQNFAKIENQIGDIFAEVKNSMTILITFPELVPF